jgi:hypothetical protein
MVAGLGRCSSCLGCASLPRGDPVRVAQGDEATLKRAVIEGLGTGKQNFGRLRQAAFAAGAYIDCVNTRV